MFAPLEEKDERGELAEIASSRHCAAGAASFAIPLGLVVMLRRTRRG